MEGQAFFCEEFTDFAGNAEFGFDLRAPVFLDDAELLEGGLQDAGEALFVEAEELEAEKEAGTGPKREDRPFHLHLRKARLVSTTGTIPLDGAYMRIRLADIAGWVIGDFSASHPFRPPTPPQHTDS